jgi:hypothetical protein
MKNISIVLGGFTALAVLVMSSEDSFSGNRISDGPNSGRCFSGRWLVRNLDNCNKISAVKPGQWRRRGVFFEVRNLP